MVLLLPLLDRRWRASKSLYDLVQSATPDRSRAKSQLSLFIEDNDGSEHFDDSITQFTNIGRDGKAALCIHSVLAQVKYM
jgi:hypothetical protein